MDVNRLCMGCMQDDSGEPVCPRCGTPTDLPPRNSLQMKPRTVLRDQYLIGRALGHGGFGITYLAWDLGLETRLAIKEYMPHGVAGRVSNSTHVLAFSDQTKIEFDYGLDRFLDEAKVLKRFRDHPGVVSIDTIFKENGTAYLVMEYLDGMTFEEFLKRRGGKVTVETALRVILPVTDALAAVHAEGILHRDISPDNIHLTRNGKVKLIDFGAARNAFGQKSRNLSIILKEGYAPEEQYRASGIQGPWTDVYATAATLYHAVTGHVPQPSLDRQAEDQLQAPGKLGEMIDPNTEAALMKALSVKAADRFQSMEDFNAALIGKVSVDPAATRKVDLGDPRIMQLEQAALSHAGVTRTGAGPPPPPPSPPPMTFAPPPAVVAQKNDRARWMVPAGLGGVALLAISAVLLFKPIPTPPDNKDKKTTVTGGGQGTDHGNNGGGQPIGRDTDRGGVDQGGTSTDQGQGGGISSGGSGDSGGKSQGGGSGQGQSSSGKGASGGGNSGGGNSGGGNSGGGSTGGSSGGGSAKGTDGSRQTDTGGGSGKQEASNGDRGFDGGGRSDGARDGSRPFDGNGTGRQGTSPDSYDGLLQAAAQATQRNGYQQAEQMLSRAISMDASRPQAYDKLGELDLYFLNQVGAAIQNYQAAIAHGGQATFHVAHDHSIGNFTTNCKGYLYVSKTQVRYKAYDSVHEFSALRSQVREFKRNRFTINLSQRTALDLKAFHVSLADGRKFNFAPLSHFQEAERDLILSIAGPD